TAPCSGWNPICVLLRFVRLYPTNNTHIEQQLDFVGRVANWFPRLARSYQPPGRPLADVLLRDVPRTVAFHTNQAPVSSAGTLRPSTSCRQTSTNRAKSARFR